MVDGKKYKVEKTSRYPYLDETDKVIDGYLVRVRLFEFDEVHEVKVPTLEPAIVETSINDLLDQRSAINNLG